MWAGTVVRRKSPRCRPPSPSPSSPIRTSRKSDKILRTCVHCGFCTATCPTYVLLGDELDSPRGRIYLIKDMLENDRPATAEVVKHIDRCLSCLSCMTTCPSGVHYMHLVDHARVHIEKTYRRPLADRCMRALLAGAAGQSAGSGWLCAPPRLAKPLAPLFDRSASRGSPPCCGSLPRACRPRRRPGGADGFPAQGPRRGRVALLAGCVTPVLGAVDQRGRDPRAHPPRHRGRAAERPGLLRRARPSHGPRARGARRGPRQYRRLDAPRSTARGSTPSWSPPPAAAPRSRTTASCCAPIRPMPTRPRRMSRLAMDISEYLARLDLSSRARPARPRGRLSRRLLAAARPENRARAERIAFQARLRGQRCAGRTSVLRFGRDLQHSAAGAREEVARAQGREYREAHARRDRRRQYRLHHADRGGHGHPGRPHRSS